MNLLWRWDTKNASGSSVRAFFMHVEVPGEQYARENC